MGAQFSSLSFQAHHYELQLVRNRLVPPRPVWASLLPEVPGLRFVLLHLSGGPGADALGHTGSLPGFAEQGLLFPEGGKVVVQVELTACRIQRRRNQLNPRSLKEAASRPGPVVRPPKEPQGQSPLGELRSARCTTSSPPHNHKSVTGPGPVSSCGCFPGVGSAVVVDQ